MKVIVQKAAGRRIDRIYDYGELHFGTRAAEKLHARIMESLHLLETHPHMGAVEPLLIGRKYTYRSFVVHEHFKLIYYIDERKQEIYIADLWDTCREPTRLTDMTK